MKKIIMTTCLLSFCFGSSQHESGDTAPEGVVSAPAAASPAAVQVPARVAVTVDLPRGRLSIYHNAPNAKKLYEEGKEKGIKSILKNFAQWREVKTSFTKRAFWSFLAQLGVVRKKIAVSCKSEDANDYGVMRGENIVATGLGSYSLMLNYVLINRNQVTHLNDKRHIKLDDCLSKMRLFIANLVSVGTELPRDLSIEQMRLAGVQGSCEEIHEIGYTLCNRQYIERMTTSPSVSRTVFYEGETISRIFYGICEEKPGSFILSKADLSTYDSAKKDSPAIDELHALLNQFITTGETSFLFAFFHKFAITMPYARGSCAINEWILEAGCRVIGVPVPKQRLYAEFDQVAQISERDAFVRFMMQRMGQPS